MTQKSDIGKLGEDLACEYLVNKAYKILDRNFRQPWGELDIVAKAPDKTLVFVEVKATGESDAFFPEENLTAAKLRKFKRTAALFAGSKTGQELINDKKSWRLDLIAITLKSFGDPEIRHYENVA